MSEPYVLAVASHKGGTGRTTAALALAWALGQRGAAVALVDADEQRSTSLIAQNARGACEWSNVTFHGSMEALPTPRTGDFVIIDPPALTAPSARRVLPLVNGILLTCLADPLSIRTVPAAATVIEGVKAANPRLELLGILINIYNERDAVQRAMLERLQQSHRDLLLEPVIPFQPNLRNWPLHPGSAPPPGPATEAFATLAANLSAAPAAL